MHSLVRALVALVAVVASATALAQSPYFLNLVVTQDDTPVCTGLGVSFHATGTSSSNLPNSPSNAVSITSLNGGTAIYQFEFVPSNTVTFSNTPVDISIPGNPTDPYTAVQYFFPASLGVPVGTGVRIDTTCSGGVATVVITNGVIAQSIAAVPTLDPRMLVALAGLLGVTGFALARRRARGAR